MSYTLVIVESPGKTAKISQYLGSGFRVRASVGHIRDLPTNRMAISEDGRFTPEYQLTDRGKAVAAQLKAEASKSSRVLLATDPDREGEAISWHIAEVLGLGAAQRITFNEITQAAVQKALQGPRAIDLNLVRAQEARRSLDRLIGYTASPTLSAVIGLNGLTGGRVQSPATRMVVDRENAIRTFVATAHFGVRLTFTPSLAPGWSADWDTKPWKAADSKYLTDGTLAQEVSKTRDVVVVSCTDADERKGPPAPFTTSTLQQVASRRLRVSVDRIMEIAQQLYEAGAITYHRTDSPNLSADGYKEIVTALKAMGLPSVTPQRTWNAKGNAQEAHEAIRPTHVEDKTPQGLSTQQQDLYTMIRERALASQMPDAINAVRTIVLEATDPISGRKPVFTARGRSPKEPGWTRLTEDDEKKPRKAEDGDDSQKLPLFPAGKRLTADNGVVLRLKTEPPSRYTEATLIKAMEKHGIGRPATYAQIIGNIQSRGYMAAEKKTGHLIPTDIAFRLIEEGTKAYSFLDLEYTAGLEQELDDIAEGRKTYQSVVGTAFNTLEQENASLRNRTTGEKTCPACGKSMIHRQSARGPFWGCSAYPACKTTADSSYRPEPPKGIPQKAGKSRSSASHQKTPGTGGRTTAPARNAGKTASAPATAAGSSLFARMNPSEAARSGSASTKNASTKTAEKPSPQQSSPTKTSSLLERLRST